MLDQVARGGISGSKLDPDAEELQVVFSSVYPSIQLFRRLVATYYKSTLPFSLEATLEQVTPCRRCWLQVDIDYKGQKFTGLDSGQEITVSDNCPVKLSCG